jgi:hypothetical protein
MHFKEYKLNKTGVNGCEKKDENFSLLHRNLVRQAQNITGVQFSLCRNVL